MQTEFVQQNPAQVQPEVLPVVPRKKPSVLKTFIVTIICLTIIVVAARIFNDPLTVDWFATLGYKPSAEIEAIENKLNLTGRGKLIFHASDPALEDNEKFNLRCDSHNQEISILGCYTESKIYLYDVKSEELSGVIESTAAHELLHAIWERLSVQEIEKLKPLLEKGYEENKELLAADLKVYDQNEYLEELHSRLATEVKNLPTELEEHYAKYFENQDNIVVFYENYITPFNKLKDEIKTLKAEMDELKIEIDKKETAYKSNADVLRNEITEFNNCATTIGCFSSDYEFQTRRSALLAKQDVLDAEYDALNAIIDEFNDNVEAYNENILRSEFLNSMINSNSEIESINK